MLDLIPLFDSLKTPVAPTTDTSRFSAHRIPEYEKHRLAKDVLGAPCLLISVADKTSEGQSVPILLEHLSVQHDMDCRITTPDGTAERGRFTVVQCVGADSSLHVQFLRVLSPIIIMLGPTPSQAQVSNLIDTLAELFRALTQPARKSVQGLWAELFLIARAREPHLLVSSWHVTPEDRYDFSAGSQRIEVKSASGRTREHYFSLEQLHPPSGTTLLVTSLFVERAGGGTSLEQLITRVRRCVSDNSSLVLHIDRITHLTLGNTWSRAMSERFDFELAKESLAFYAEKSIPKLSADLPVGISEVRFKSDLSTQSPLGLSQLQESKGLFSSAVPERTA